MNRAEATGDTRSLWTNLRSTPLADMLRGRLTGSLDVGRIIRAAALPSPLADLVRQITRRTRLSRGEQADVARELAEHFRDGVAAGRLVEEVIGRFGDARQAARLIRRAKLRARPLGWRMWRRAKQAAGLLLAVFVACWLLLLVRFVGSQRRIEHDYLTEISDAAAALPEAQRAWPVYCDALAKMAPPPKADSRTRPGDPAWPEVVQWDADNQAALTALREGTRRPHLGYLAVGDPPATGAQEVRSLWALGSQIFLSLLPVANALTWDAQVAGNSGEPGRLVDDVAALVGLAEQVHRDFGFSITERFAFTALDDALQIVNEMLADHPALLSDGELTRLAHVISSYADGGVIRCRLDGDRLVMRDILQRLYSDDGRGNGWFCAESLEGIAELDPNPTPVQLTLDKQLFGALWGPFWGSRHELSELGEAVLDLTEGELERPMWQWTGSAVDDQLAKIGGLSRSPLLQLGYFPFVMWHQRVAGDWHNAELETQCRDATLTALALTLYHRRYDAWPAQLADLVPELLPAVPVDRFTGNPLGYRLVAGRPVLYSVGPDLVDDGGRAMQNWQAVYHWMPTKDGRSPLAASAGDWILWPPVEDRPERPAAANSAERDDS